MNLRSSTPWPAAALAVVVALVSFWTDSPARGQQPPAATAPATQISQATQATQATQPADAAAPAAPASTRPAKGAVREGVEAGEAAGPAAPRREGGISLLWSAPFVLLLACIALMPFIHKHFWEHNYPWVTLVLALIPAAYYFFLADTPTRWVHGMQEYVSFVILLGSLFVVSGGIAINIGRRATPATNVTLLLVGALLSNVFGTTGASMLLIRPFLRVNRGHLKPYHVVFFIFVVSNVGGSLTPIGDPPLFLGYLRGIPFWWVFTHCFLPWAMAVGLLLAVFFVIDTLDHKRAERPHPEDPGVPVSFVGIQNFLFITMVLVGVFMPGLFDVIEEIRKEGAEQHAVKLFYCRELLMLAAAVLSRVSTSKLIYERNGFTFGPIKEVAILFVGIFSTMAPTLHWLEANAEKLPIKTPGQFYFATGALSSFLDNAPTYLTFLQARLGELDQTQVEAELDDLNVMAAAKTLQIPARERDPMVQAALKELIRDNPEAVLEGKVSVETARISFLLGWPQYTSYVVAISLGAVFFGACTYIGNGPNFMVKSIADADGSVQTPSFFGYILKYTIPVLLPIYAAVWWVFFA
jgi:Na+/H+ antiporter NhaD/arsenite permease-like protein